MLEREGRLRRHMEKRVKPLLGQRVDSARLEELTHPFSDRDLFSARIVVEIGGVSMLLSDPEYRGMPSVELPEQSIDLTERFANHTFAGYRRGKGFNFSVVLVAEDGVYTEITAQRFGLETDGSREITEDTPTYGDAVEEAELARQGVVTMMRIIQDQFPAAKGIADFFDVSPRQPSQ